MLVKEKKNVFPRRLNRNGALQLQTHINEKILILSLIFTHSQLLTQHI